MAQAEQDAMLEENGRLISRAEQRVTQEQEVAATAERAGWDTSLPRRIVAVLREWLELLLERRSILLKWGGRREDAGDGPRGR